LPGHVGIVAKKQGVSRRCGLLAAAVSWGMGKAPASESGRYNAKDKQRQDPLAAAAWCCQTVSN
jgi:hypothetical protein